MAPKVKSFLPGVADTVSNVIVGKNLKRTNKRKNRNVGGSTTMATTTAAAGGGGGRVGLKGMVGKGVNLALNAYGLARRKLRSTGFQNMVADALVSTTQAFLGSKVCYSTTFSAGYSVEYRAGRDYNLAFRLSATPEGGEEVGYQGRLRFKSIDDGSNGGTSQWSFEDHHTRGQRQSASPGRNTRIPNITRTYGHATNSATPGAYSHTANSTTPGAYSHTANSTTPGAYSHTASGTTPGAFKYPATATRTQSTHRHHHQSHSLADVNGSTKYESPKFVPFHRSTPATAPHPSLRIKREMKQEPPY